MLDVSGLNAWYDESHVLHGMDFEVREGEVVTLLGRNGAGKTTTLKAIMGLMPKRTGSIKFTGHGNDQRAAGHRGPRRHRLLPGRARHSRRSYVRKT